MHATKKQKYLIPFALLAVVVAAYSFKPSTHGNRFEIQKNIEIFLNIFKELDAHYVDTIPVSTFIKSGLDSMLQSLDPYSTFISEGDEMEEYKQQTTGRYGGIGAVIEKRTDYVIIAEPYFNAPAQQAGIKAGDKILEIDGVSAKNKSTDEVSRMLKGEANTTVKVKVESPANANKISLKEITRREITVPSVPYYGVLPNSPSTGYIRLTSFTDQCSREVAQALKALKQKNNITTLVLDLRDNPGGLLDEAIETANIFLPKGTTIVQTVEKNKAPIPHKTNQEPLDLNIPLAILVDRESASAAEIVAGSMQDLDRAVIIGQRSFGKGLVQTVKDVGFNCRVKFTNAKYQLPSGRCIQAIDYSGGYTDRLEKVPDSLRTAYRTKNNRIVYNASGIEPDIATEVRYLSNVSIGLLEKQLIFDYATQYANLHPQIAEPNKFELSEPDFQAFLTFLNQKNFDYKTETERLLKELKDQAQKEKYSAAIETELKTLENSLKHDKNQDLEKFKSEIREMLEYEIVARYYYQTGRIEEGLEDDTDVQKATEMLAQNDIYKKTLKQK